MGYGTVKMGKYADANSIAEKLQQAAFAVEGMRETMTEDMAATLNGIVEKLLASLNVAATTEKDKQADIPGTEAFAERERRKVQTFAEQTFKDNPQQARAFRETFANAQKRNPALAARTMTGE